MSEEEEDYMSDKFLSGKLDVRPSLIQDRAKKRHVEIAVKHTEQIKRNRQQQLERNGSGANERLQESLMRPIEADNKGFQLLAKMGYTPGHALGRVKQTAISTTGGHPLTEPIAITIKSGRGGLGREAALLELADKRRQLRQDRLRKAAGGEVVTAEEFRRRATQKAEERFLQGAFRRCQLTCENLDIEHRIQAPEIPWFWPERPSETLEEFETETKLVESTATHDETATTDDTEVWDEYTIVEKMELLTSYLRTSYIFCFWCGVRYEDQADMNSNCPGLTRDEH